MFLDSDDYLAPNACETAVKAISQGYDMVKFGADVINSLNAPLAVITDASDFCNRGENCEYFNDQIITNIFRDGKISWHVWSYIYLREIVAAAFAELPSEYATGPDDLYALLATARQARNLRKIEDRLLFYNFGPGVSATYDKAKVLKYAPAIANTICAVRRYAENYSLNIGLERLYPNLCGDLLERLLPAGSDADVAACFNELTERLGLPAVLNSLVTRHYKHHDKIAALIQPLANRQTEAKIRKIGIFFPRLHFGGAESMIQSLTNLLTDAGYQVTIFAEGKSERIMPLPAGVNQVYIGGAGTSKQNLLERLRNLEQVARESGIDLMLHAATNVPYLLWDLMVMRHLQIPMIFLHRFNFAWSFSERGAKLRQSMEAAFRSADAVICMSHADELYLRFEGINAVYLPPAIKQHEYQERQQVPQAIAVLGRLGDPVKQVGDSLKIMQRIVSRAPWVTLYLIGDFYTPEQREEYQRILQEYGLVKNVILTGLTEKPDQFLQKCGVLLSVSALESFPMNIAEAQALGLPCVIYDVPIEIGRDNPSIISVPQGDVAGASAAILELLEDADKWRALSHIAVENTRQFAPELIRSKLTQLLNNLHKSSPIRPKNADDYERIIRYSGKYSGKSFAEKWQDVVETIPKNSTENIINKNKKPDSQTDAV